MPGMAHGHPRRGDTWHLLHDAVPNRPPDEEEEDWSKYHVPWGDYSALLAGIAREEVGERPPGAHGAPYSREDMAEMVEMKARLRAWTAQRNELPPGAARAEANRGLARFRNQNTDFTKNARSRWARDKLTEMQDALENHDLR